jgi:Flp pilus assembly protein TadG
MLTAPVGSGIRPRSRGQALVELALVLPIFLVLFMGVVDLGGAFFAYNSVTNAAREGTRLAVVNQDTSKITQRATQQSAIAQTPTLTIAFYQAAADGTPDTTMPCPTVGSSYIAVGCLAVITFQATYHPITPVIGNILFKTGVTFTAKSVQSVEYSCPNSTQTAAQCPKQP